MNNFACSLLLVFNLQQQASFSSQSVWVPLYTVPIASAIALHIPYKNFMEVVPPYVFLFHLATAILAHSIDAQGNARCFHPYWMNRAGYCIDNLLAMTTFVMVLHVIMGSIERGRRLAFVAKVLNEKIYSSIREKNKASRFYVARMPYLCFVALTFHITNSGSCVSPRVELKPIGVAEKDDREGERAGSYSLENCVPCPSSQS